MISAVILGMLTCLTVDVTFIELNGSEDTGEWLACDQTGYVALRTKIGVQRLATRDLLAVRFPENADARTEITWPMIVWGTSGSRFPATALQSNEEQFVLRTPFARELHLPLDHVAAVYWTRHGEPSQEFVNSVKARGADGGPVNGGREVGRSQCRVRARAARTPGGQPTRGSGGGARRRARHLRSVAGRS